LQGFFLLGAELNQIFHLHGYLNSKGPEVKKCCPCNFRGKAYFDDFCNVLQLSYKPSNLAQQTSPMPWLKG